MKYIFGPVPSRRLGRSLGVDPTARPGSEKACNWNCVYCQLGHTHHLMAERQRFFQPEAMLDELRKALVELVDGVDWVTFVGSGEPTLNIDLGIMLRGIKAMTELPVAVITNGSTLSLPEVRADLAGADAVLPTLDAGNELTYLRINRPQHHYTFQSHIDGLTAFRQEYLGKLWLETMLVAGLNDDESSLEQLASIVEDIAPDELHLVLPTRPPTEPWVLPTDAEGLLRAMAILGRVTKVVHPDEAYGDFSLGADALLQTLTRTGRVHMIRRYGKIFWLGSLP